LLASLSQPRISTRRKSPVRAMNLRKEVLHRLVLAKSILSLGQSSSVGQPNAHLVAKQVLNGHDAADLAFAAIADQQGKLPATGRIPFMMQCLELIDTVVDKQVLYFSALNEARNALKHTGNLPNTAQWANVCDDVFHKLSGICHATLGTSLEELDESELLVNDRVTAHLVAAKAARTHQDFKRVLEELAKSLFLALEQTPGWNEYKLDAPTRKMRSNSPPSAFLQTTFFGFRNFCQWYPYRHGFRSGIRKSKVSYGSKADLDTRVTGEMKWQIFVSTPASVLR
jgi:hypothetical protein